MLDMLLCHLTFNRQLIALPFVRRLRSRLHSVTHSPDLIVFPMAEASVARLWRHDASEKLLPSPGLHMGGCFLWLLYNFTPLKPPVIRGSCQAKHKVLSTLVIQCVLFTYPLLHVTHNLTHFVNLGEALLNINVVAKRQINSFGSERVHEDVVVSAGCFSPCGCHRNRI